MSAPGFAPPSGQPSGPPSGAPQGPPLDGGPIPFTRLVRMEFRKAIDTVASFWLVATILILVIMVEGALLLIVLVEESRSSFADYVAIAQFISGWSLPVLAVMLVTTEWSQRTAMVTFAIEPRRLHVIAAKYVVAVLITLAATAAALVVGLLCTGLCELIQPDQTEWSTNAGTIAGFVVINVLAMSLGFGLGCLLLNTPAAIVAFFVYRILPLVAFAILAGIFDWFADIQPWISFEYAQGPLYEWDVDTAEEWGNLLVSGFIWLGLPMGIGLYRILKAEVK